MTNFVGVILLLTFVVWFFIVAWGGTIGERCSGAGYKDAQHERCVRRVKNGGPVYEDNTDYWKKGGWHDVK